MTAYLGVSSATRLRLPEYPVKSYGMQARRVRQPQPSGRHTASLQRLMTLLPQ